MIEKIKLHKKILLTSILVILIVISAGVYILAIDTKELVPEIDLYRNGSVNPPHEYPVYNGSGVEYNGFRVGSIV